MEWCSGGELDWIVTTGGTGFGVRDQTPEALTPLIERNASGLVHLMMSSSIKHTPLAALSRPVAGTIKNTLVVTLPGSVKAVKENMDALLSSSVVNHAIELTRGGTGKQVHATLAAAGSGHTHHHHDHGHGHQEPRPRTLAHDPSAGASARHRISPYPLISLQAALKAIQEKTDPLGTQRKLVTQALRGHVLAEEFYVPQNVPSTSTTSVDGYALRCMNFLPFPLLDIPHQHWPAGTDTVIMVEDTRLVSAVDGEEKEVECLVQVPVGETCARLGRMCATAISFYRRAILSREIGTLTFVGREDVEVYKRPVVAILSTGNELLDLQNPRSLGRRLGWYLGHQSSIGLGYEVVDLGIVADELNVAALRRGLDSADIIISTGGTSMGPSDLLKPVLEQHFDGTIHFGRVTVKPGKPTTFATVPYAGGTSKPVFALPGNPASALVTFYVFVVPALRRAVSLSEGPRATRQRHAAYRVVIRVDKNSGMLMAKITGRQRSSRVASLAGANKFVVLPMRTKGWTRLEVGERAEAVVMGEILVG
ncbi:MoaB/Mog domain-containing protein [Mycena amicta]|nr:MoaB/Mog domain-containing protein [Mycena amicta]